MKWPRPSRLLPDVLPSLFRALLVSPSASRLHAVPFPSHARRRRTARIRSMRLNFFARARQTRNGAERFKTVAAPYTTPSSRPDYFPCSLNTLSKTGRPKSRASVSRVLKQKCQSDLKTRKFEIDTAQTLSILIPLISILQIRSNSTRNYGVKCHNLTEFAQILNKHGAMLQIS